jgi:nitrate/nitrite transporter NarK
MVLTLVGATFPLAQSQAIGFAATGGGIGAFLFPFVMSVLSQAWGIQWGFAAYAGFAVLMTVSAVGLVRSARKAG